MSLGLRASLSSESVLDNKIFMDYKPQQKNSKGSNQLNNNQGPEKFCLRELLEGIMALDHSNRVFEIIHPRENGPLRSKRSGQLEDDKKMFVQLKLKKFLMED